MSIRSELRTLIRLAPEVDTDLITNANLDTLLDKWSIDLALKGRAIPKNVKFTITADQQEYNLTGSSPVVSDDDFLDVDLDEGGFLFDEAGNRWVGPPELKPKTKAWLDINYPGWRTNSSASSPIYWYLGAGTSAEKVIGLVDKPSTTRSNGGWLHYLSRGKLMTDDTHYPWTGSTTQLIHLEPYEILAVPYCLDYIQRYILHNTNEADKHLQIYLAGAQAMAKRFPLMDHLDREGFKAESYFGAFSLRGGRRF